MVFTNGWWSRKKIRNWIGILKKLRAIAIRHTPSATTIGTEFTIFFQQGYQGRKFTVCNLFLFVSNANSGTISGAFYGFVTFFARLVGTIFMFKTKQIFEIGSASGIFQPRFWINGKASF